MTKYQAVPHQFYLDKEEEVIHFDEDSLALTELSQLHRTVLAEFAQMRTKNEVLKIHDDDQNVAEVINELVELGLMREKLPLIPPHSFNLRPNIRAFRIVLTEKCNLKCVECFVTKRADNLSTMTEDRLAHAIRETILYGAKDRVTYHFFGGEPLLRFELIKHAVTILEKAVTEGRIVRPLYAITTNATVISDEIISFFKEYDFKVGVSVDGPKEINDHLRIYGDGRGTFKDIERNYKRLMATGIDCHILITPHPNHLDELPRIFRSVLEIFPMKTVTVNTPLHFDTIQWTVPGERYAKLLIEIMRIAREFEVSVDSAASPPLAALAGNVRREGPCALVCDTVMASISPDGNISFCSQKWHPFLTVPIVSETTFKMPIRRTDDCLTCEALGICGGPCPAFQQISGNPLDNNKCDFMRSLLREVATNLDLFEEPK